MAKVTFVKAAKKAIYKNGLSRKNKRGFDERILTIPADDKDEILVQVGQPYYWWKHRFRTKSISLTAPSAAQTMKYGKSEYEVNMDDYEERKTMLLDQEGNKEDKSQLESDIEEFRDELQERLDRIPEALQESSILNERIETLDDLITEVQAIEVSDEDDEEDDEDDD